MAPINSTYVGMYPFVRTNGDYGMIDTLLEGLTATEDEAEADDVVKVDKGKGVDKSSELKFDAPKLKILGTTETDGADQGREKAVFVKCLDEMMDWNDPLPKLANKQNMNVLTLLASPKDTNKGMRIAAARALAFPPTGPGGLIEFKLKHADTDAKVQQVVDEAISLNGEWQRHLVGLFTALSSRLPLSHKKLPSQATRGKAAPQGDSVQLPPASSAAEHADRLKLLEGAIHMFWPGVFSGTTFIFMHAMAIFLFELRGRGDENLHRFFPRNEPPADSQGAALPEGADFSNMPRTLATCFAYMAFDAEILSLENALKWAVCLSHAEQEELEENQREREAEYRRMCDETKGDVDTHPSAGGGG